MPHENMRHYLLDPMEAELVACYRMLSDDMRAAVIGLIAAQMDWECHKLDTPAEMRIIER